MSNADRIVRLIVAAVIGVLYFSNIITGILGLVLVVLAGIFILTSFVSFCPLYAIFGVSTCAVKKPEGS